MILSVMCFNVFFVQDMLGQKVKSLILLLEQNSYYAYISTLGICFENFALIKKLLFDYRDLTVNRLKRENVRALHN